MIVAATGVQRALLQVEFASLTFVDLPGYRVKYGKNRAITVLRLICSIPKILICIKKERAWLRGFAAREGVDLVISDNRYGLAVPGVFCVFITHQLLIQSGFGRWTDLLLQRINYRLINRFSRCWVPDNRADGSLAGRLSHPARMPKVTTRYVGVLSRMEAGGIPGQTNILVLLSGPEPQRTLLEQRILREAPALTERMTLVRGLPGGGKALSNLPDNITVYDHLPAKELQRVMADARLVIARSGYSTVMDLVRLRKRAVLIPTPGQTEQEYLGRYLAAKGWIVSLPQHTFTLKKALAAGEPVNAWPVDDAGKQLHVEILSVLAQSRPSALG